jgi:hypothetical protein
MNTLKNIVLLGAGYMAGKMSKKTGPGIGAVKKDYSYWEKRTPKAGRKAVLKDVYGSRFAKKTVTIVRTLPNLGNFWLVRYGKNEFAVHAKDIERIIVSRIK